MVLQANKCQSSNLATSVLEGSFTMLDTEPELGIVWDIGFESALNGDADFSSRRQRTRRIANVLKFEVLFV